MPEVAYFTFGLISPQYDKSIPISIYCNAAINYDISSLPTLIVFVEAWQCGFYISKLAISVQHWNSPLVVRRAAPVYRQTLSHGRFLKSSLHIWGQHRSILVFNPPQFPDVSNSTSQTTVWRTGMTSWLQCVRVSPTHRWHATVSCCSLTGDRWSAASAPAPLTASCCEKGGCDHLSFF